MCYSFIKKFKQIFESYNDDRNIVGGSTDENLTHQIVNQEARELMKILLVVIGTPKSSYNI